MTAATKTREQSSDARALREALQRDRCPRCGGLMIGVESFASVEDLTPLAGTARRCVQCGEVLDPVILQNRQADRLHRQDDGR